MQHLVYFYISLTFCLCFCKGSVKTVLEVELKRTNRQKYEASIDIRHLVNELNTENEECDKSLREFEFNTNARNPKFQILVKAMSSHWADTYLMNSRKEQIIEAGKNIEKLQLGIQISKMDILKLEERRRNGLTSQCLFLEGMAPAVHEPRNSLSGNDESPEETLIVLQNQLQAAQSELSKLLFEKMEKKTRRKVKKALCGLEHQRLNEALQKLNRLNNKEAVKAVNILALKLQTVKGQVEKAARGASVMFNNLNMDVLKSQAKKETRDQKRFVSENLCYAKMTENLRWDENFWKLWNEPWLKELMNNNPRYSELDPKMYFPSQTW